MRARNLLAVTIAAAHPDFEVVQTMRKIAEIEPGKTALVQIIRQSIAPGTGSMFTESLDVWVLDPSIDTDTVEDSLDDNTDDVIDTIVALDAPVMWEKATRQLHPSGLHGYRLQVTATTQPETLEAP